MWGFVFPNSGTPEVTIVYLKGQSNVGRDTLPPSLALSNTACLFKSWATQGGHGILICSQACHPPGWYSRVGALGSDEAHIILLKWGKGWGEKGEEVHVGPWFHSEDHQQPPGTQRSLARLFTGIKANLRAVMGKREKVWRTPSNQEQEQQLSIGQDTSSLIIKTFRKPTDRKALRWEKDNCSSTSRLQQIWRKAHSSQSGMSAHRCDSRPHLTTGTPPVSNSYSVAQIIISGQKDLGPDHQPHLSKVLVPCLQLLRSHH